MTIDIVQCDQLPDRDALNGVLRAYYSLIVQRMRDMGANIDASDPEIALAEFWDNADTYLPPKGCLVIAQDQSGTIVGCGMLKCLDSNTGELKRLFVQPSARGTGAGRRLVEARVEAARKMGLTRLVVDTLTPNVEMRSLYAKLGFTELTEPIETTSHLQYPELRPFMHYFAKDISPA